MRQVISIKYFKFILKVFLVLFLTTVFSFFSCASDNFTFTLLYSVIYTNCRTFPVLLQNSNTVSFDCSRIVNGLFLCYHLLQQLLKTLFVELPSDRRLKLFVCLSQLQLVFLWNTYNFINSLSYNYHLVLLILS